LAAEGDVTGVTITPDSQEYTGAAQAISVTATFDTSAPANADGMTAAIMDATGAEKVADATIGSYESTSRTMDVTPASALLPGTYKVSLTTVATKATVTSTDAITVSYAKGAVDEANKAWALAQVSVNAEKDADGDYFFEQTGAPVNFKATGVVDKVHGTLNLDQYRVAYKGTGSTVYAESATAPTAAGSYAMVVYPAGDLVEFGATYAACTKGVEVPFTIAAPSAPSNASLYQKHAGSADTSDVDFYRTGSSFDALANSSNVYTGVGLLVDGVAKDLAVSGHAAKGQYYVKTVNGNSTGTAKALGTYRLGIAKAAEANSADDAVLFYLDLEVKAFDLSKATVVIEDTELDATPADTVVPLTSVSVKIGADKLEGAEVGSANLLADDGNTVATEVTAFEPAKGAANPGVSGKFDALGKYTVKFAPKDDTVKSVVGEATANVNIVKEVDADFTYDGKEFDAGDVKDAFNTALGEAFDPAKVKNASLEDSEFTVSVYKDGEKVDDWSAPGSYTAVAQVNVDGKFEKGGSDSLSFTVTNGNITAANVVVSVDGNLIAANGTASLVYDGAPAAIVTDVKLMDGDEVVKTLAEGTDYRVVVTKDGKEVESIQDAGTYVVKVKSDVYTIADAQYNVVVDPRTVSAAADGMTVDQATYGVYGSADKVTGIRWTGEAIAPTVLYKASADSKKADTVLPQDAYTVTYKQITNPDDCVTLTTEKVDGVDVKTGGWTYNEDAADFATVSEVKDAGFYVMTVADSAADANFTVVTAELAFRVVSNVTFTDVSSDAWYAPEVAKAFENGYVNGITAGVFAPEQTMQRCEFAQVVFNMAGGTIDKDKVYPTRFSDVPADAWFAQAVEWASRYGIVNGKSADEFDPYGTITREEIATMLYRYAGNNAQADASVLDQFTDASQVSDWAKTAMAWAVEEGYMNGKGANDLQPQATATRAEIAALAVRVQPEAL
jgi:hypothetical protein